MGEVSNKTLATLLVVAILISLGGTFVSLNKLGKGGILFSGMATTNNTQDTGYVTLNITNYLSILLEGDDTINFGSGSIADVTAGAQTCESADGTTGSNWNGTTGVCGTSTKDVLTILNDGSIDANVTLTSTSDAADFLGATSTSPVFQYKYLEGACEGTTQASNTDLDKTEQLLCGDLDPAERMNVSAYVSIPIDAATGTHVATWTFTAYCANSNCAND